MKKLQPPGWAEPKGYANGVMAPDALIFVCGQIGWNAAQVCESDDFIAQTCQALINIAAVLKAGGPCQEHMICMTWYVTVRVEYSARLKDLGAAYRKAVDGNFPAVTCVELSGLVEKRSRIKIEVTAVLPN